MLNISCATPNSCIFLLSYSCYLYLVPTFIETSTFCRSNKRTYFPMVSFTLTGILESKIPISIKSPSFWRIGSATSPEQGMLTASWSEKWYSQRRTKTGIMFSYCHSLEIDPGVCFKKNIHVLSVVITHHVLGESEWKCEKQLYNLRIKIPSKNWQS